MAFFVDLFISFAIFDNKWFVADGQDSGNLRSNE